MCGEVESGFRESVSVEVVANGDIALFCAGCGRFGNAAGGGNVSVVAVFGIPVAAEGPEC